MMKWSLAFSQSMFVCSCPQIVRRQTLKTIRASRVLEYVVHKMAALIHTETRKTSRYFYTAVVLLLNIQMCVILENQNGRTELNPAHTHTQISIRAIIPSTIMRNRDADMTQNTMIPFSRREGCDGNEMNIMTHLSLFVWAALIEDNCCDLLNTITSRSLQLDTRQQKHMNTGLFASHNPSQTQTLHITNSKVWKRLHSHLRPSDGQLVLRMMFNDLMEVQ